MRNGIWYGIGAYCFWGFMPVYWKFLQRIAALQLIGHRILWSCVLLGMFVLLSGQWQSFRTKAFTARVVGTYTIAAALITVNWLVYVWAVNAGNIVETSLGYYINPLISVLLGMIFLREHLRPLQWIALGLAFSGVVYLSVLHGSLPWIALTLAVSFALYGLVKKTATLGSVHGLMLETGLLALPALAYLLYLDHRGEGAFLHTGAMTDGLLIGAGLVTTVPLLLFASAAQRIPLLWVGLLQYIAPTLQMVLGVFVYREPMTHERLIGFAMVWAALIVFAVEGMVRYRASVVSAKIE